MSVWSAVVQLTGGGHPDTVATPQPGWIPHRLPGPDRPDGRRLRRHAPRPLEAFHADRRPRPDRPGRRRAFGGDAFDLDPADQFPLTVVWPRQYPTREVLGFLFGASDSSALRAGARCLPLLEKAGREHGLARLRRYQALSQVDRRRRRAQTARVRAAAGPVNRRMGHHEAA